MQSARFEYQNPSISVREVRCASLLHKLNFKSSDEYTANFYSGCTHSCAYCYAPSLIHDERSWGTYVDAKVNAPRVLRKELGKTQKKSVVFLSSASDPYQPLEARFKITRRCLEVLLDYDFPLVILTRSPLVLRDIDILKKFSWVRVGCSISSVSTKFYEPGVVSVFRRIETLRKLHESGIVTWVSMAPVIPRIVLHDIDALLEKLKESGVSCVVLGMLRFIGYEESRIMFEERTNRFSEIITRGEEEIYKKTMRLVKKYGLSDSKCILDWKEEPIRKCNLDEF